MDGRCLLTGATGLLGGSFYERVYRSGSAGDWLLLVRGANEDACRARLARNLSRHMDKKTALAAAAVCGVVPGDLLSLGGNPDPRLDEVSHVVHLAADTSFFGRDQVWK